MLAYLLDLIPWSRRWDTTCFISCGIGYMSITTLSRNYSVLWVLESPFTWDMEVNDVLFQQAFQSHSLTGHLEVGQLTDVVHDVNDVA